MIKRIWFGVVILCVVFNGWLAASQEAVDLAGLEAYFEQARREWRIPGMAVAIVKDGEKVLARIWPMNCRPARRVLTVV